MTAETRRTTRNPVARSASSAPSASNRALAFVELCDYAG